MFPPADGNIPGYLLMFLPTDGNIPGYLLMFLQADGNIPGYLRIILQADGNIPGYLLMFPPADEPSWRSAQISSSKELFSRIEDTNLAYVNYVQTQENTAEQRLG